MGLILNGTFVLMSTGGLDQRDVSPCTIAEGQIGVKAVNHSPHSLQDFISFFFTGFARIKSAASRGRRTSRGENATGRRFCAMAASPRSSPSSTSSTSGVQVGEKDSDTGFTGWPANLVADLGWVDFAVRVPPTCPLAQPLLPNSHKPRQS